MKNPNLETTAHSKTRVSKTPSPPGHAQHFLHRPFAWQRTRPGCVRAALLGTNQTRAQERVNCFSLRQQHGFKGRTSLYTDSSVWPGGHGQKAIWSLSCRLQSLEEERRRVVRPRSHCYAEQRTARARIRQDLLWDQLVSSPWKRISDGYIPAPPGSEAALLTSRRGPGCVELSSRARSRGGIGQPAGRNVAAGSAGLRLLPAGVGPAPLPSRAPGVQGPSCLASEPWVKELLVSGAGDRERTTPVPSCCRLPAPCSRACPGRMHPARAVPWGSSGCP